eukprot:jgi/Chrzof1/3675/Cz13g04190.t1
MLRMRIAQTAGPVRLRPSQTTLLHRLPCGIPGWQAHRQIVRISHVAQAKGRLRKVTTEGGDADDADAESAPKPTSRGRRKKTTTASKAEHTPTDLPGGAVAAVSEASSEAGMGVELLPVDLMDPSSSQPAGGELPPTGKPKRGGRKKSTTASKAADKAAQSAADVSPSAADVASQSAADVSSGLPVALQSDVNVTERPDYPPVMADEDDPRRFAIHRELNSAAGNGDTVAAEECLVALVEEGFVPGPRAYHGLLFAYCKAGDMEGALAVAERASEADVTLLTESYQALIYAYMNESPPNTQMAREILNTMLSSGVIQDITPAWTTLSRQLHLKGLAEDFVSVMQQGLEAGFKPSGEVAAPYLAALCDLGQKDVAYRFVDALQSSYGIPLKASHINPLILAESMDGDFEAAQHLINTYDGQGVAITADSYNGILAGLVANLDAEEGPEGPVVSRFNSMREQMLRSCIAPNKHTFKYLYVGHVKLGAVDEAVADLNNMRKAAGVDGLRLLDADTLTQLLQLLVQNDMPVSLLQVLSAMFEDGCRLPPEATAALGDSGRTLISAWVNDHHLDVMAVRGQEAAGNLAKEVTQSIRFIDDMPVGVGDVVVDDEGVMVPLTKLTVKEMRVEAVASGFMDADEAHNARRVELLPFIKDHRVRMPFPIAEFYKVLATRRKAEGRSSSSSTASSSKKEEDARATAKMDEVWVKTFIHNQLTNVEVRQVPRAEPKYMRTRGLDEIDPDIPVEYNWASPMAKITDEMDVERMLGEGNVDEVR